MSRSIIGLSSLRRPHLLVIQHPRICFLSTFSTDTKSAPLEKTAKKKKKISSSELRKQRNKLAVSSLKDIFDSFMSSSSEDDVFEIDPKPIYAQPTKFLTLNQPLQQCVLDDLQTQLKKKWTSLPLDVKRFHYWVSYGSYGPRDSFPSIDSVDPPLDLPFKPHSLSSSSKVIKKQNYRINLNRLGLTRAKQAEKDSRMDPFSKGILFVFFLLTLLNFKRDSKVQSSGKVPVNKYEQMLVERERLEEELKKRNEQQETAELEAQRAEVELKLTKGKRWYYLWLK